MSTSSGAGPGAAPGRRTRRIAWMVVTLIAMGGVVAATEYAVTQRNDFTALYAERVNLGDGFTVSPSTLSPALADLPAVGVLGAPALLTNPASVARTAIAQDDWVYHVTINEKPSGPAGQFTAELFVNDNSVGQLQLQQKDVTRTDTRSVDVRFDVGPKMVGSTLFYLVVRPLVQTGPTVGFTVKSSGTTPVWLGVDGKVDNVSIAGKSNPGLKLPLGSTLLLTAVNGDGVRHSVGVIADNPPKLPLPAKPLAGYYDMSGTVGDQVVVSFTPPAAGTYTYVCQIHPNTQWGTVTVTGS